MTSLATFIDRHTMRHTRVYPHPVDRVWDAITDEEQVSKWMGFEVHFPKLEVGGRCIWGPEDGEYFQTEISRLEPKTLIEHAGANTHPTGGYIRFELSPHDDGCRFDFTQHFAPGGTHEEVPDDLGGDLPGGPETPWRPGFVGGFHDAFDGLGQVLDGKDPATVPGDPRFRALVDEWLKRGVRQHEFTGEVADRYRRQLYGVSRWNELNEIYRDHIRKTIPSE